MDVLLGESLRGTDVRVQVHYDPSVVSYEQLLESYPQGDWTDLARSRLRSMEALSGGPTPDTSSPEEPASAPPVTSS